MTQGSVSGHREVPAPPLFLGDEMATMLKRKDIKVRPVDYPKPPAGNYPPQSEAFESLVRHVGSFGLLTPIFVNRSNLCLSGHYRLWAAERLDMDMVPVVYAESLQDCKV